MMAVWFWSIAAMEWFYDVLKSPRSPWVLTVAAVGVTAWALLKISGCRKRMDNLKLGQRGEQLVAEHLEALRPLGFRPLNDLVAGRFNIDHVLVGPQGIFAVETKTRSKSGGREEKIQVDGSRILIGGRVAEPNPADQAKANAGWIRELLARSTGREFRVEPIVIFPGWWVEFSQKPNGMFVMNEKGLKNIIAKLPVVLTKEEIAMASLHLEQFVRASAENKKAGSES